VPRGAPDTFRNPSTDREVRVAFVHTPAVGFEEYIARFRRLIERGSVKSFSDPKSLMHISYKVGERIFARGKQGDELFLIRRGSVRIRRPLNDKQGYHLATFARGSFFGG
jgi:CRP-like cAMP-binding protein